MAVVAALTLVAGGIVLADWWSVVPDDVTPVYVGRQSCIQCHAQQSAGWQGSHHDLAMDLAGPHSVLGNFDNAQLAHHGVTSRMYRQDGKYMIHTEGPDGRMDDFEIKYVFGVDPLQQYMVEFGRSSDMAPDEIPRVQVLRVSWDTQRQRWFYLPPPDVDEKLAPEDDLHWTGIAQRWNNMCADCHSTHLQKNFDHRTKRYHTTFSEIDVSCEACHGPASLHVELATRRSLFWDRKRGYGLAKLKGADTRPQIETCAPCHSRRSTVYPGFRPAARYHDYYANALLDESAYHADGQILDEVYVYGSFLQSKMHRENVRCTDCHDPHSTRVKFDDNRLCTSCHQHPAGKYDTPAHHRHDMGSPGARCIECHMPATTYMEVDPRRDHGFRVPRPDLSVRLGTPNACSGCHLEKAPLAAQRQENLGEYADWLNAARGGDEEVAAALADVDGWAADVFHQWYGEKPDAETHFAAAVVAARRGEPGAVDALMKIALNRGHPGIVRASCLAELGRFASPETAALVEPLLDDPDPQVRAAAVVNLELLDDRELIRLALPLLDDPIRSVRTQAARLLARVPRAELRGPERQKLASILEEFKAGVLVNNDRALAHVTLGILFETMQDIPNALAAYRLGMHVEPGVTGPRTNLAALLERLAERGRQQAGQLAGVQPAVAQRTLQQAVQYGQEVAQLRREELSLLERDAALLPDSAALQYRYGLALYLNDRLEDAETALKRAVQLEPSTPDFTLALALLYQKQERYAQALQYAQMLLELRPDDPTFRQLVEGLRRQAE